MASRIHHPRLVFGLLLLFGVVVAASLSPLRIATGNSLPKGFYWLSPPSPSRGDIALACLPAPAAKLGRARGYLRAGECEGGVRPVGKSVAAVQGDFISLGQGEIRVNGVRIGTHSPPDLDSRGRPLSRVPDGTYEVGRGEVWLVSTHHPLSWDSRFFGPVSERDILGELLPIWVLAPAMSSEPAR